MQAIAWAPDWVAMEDRTPSHYPLGREKRVISLPSRVHGRIYTINSGQPELVGF
jgi:hypothetical protein